MDFSAWFNFARIWLDWHGAQLDLGTHLTILCLTVSSLIISLIAVVIHNYRLNQEVKRRQQIESYLRISEQRFRRAIAMAPFPIMLHADDGEVIHINSTWTQITGYTQQDIPTTQAWAALASGKSSSDVLHHTIASKDNWKSVLDNGTVTIYTAQDKQRIWTFSSVTLDPLPDGRHIMITMAVDITQSRQTELALKDSEQRYRSIYNQAAVGLANGTLNGKFVDVNPRFCEMLGYSREELLAKSVDEITYSADRAQSNAILQSLFSDQTSYRFHENRYLRKDGSYFWCSIGMSLVRDIQGNPKHTLAVIRDISNRVKIEEQLKHDALHDELTGLPNRSLLMERLELALKRTKRHSETQLAVLFLDLDNFKLVNDSLGHLVGDKLLLAISTKLKLVIRETDLAARLGGDEFVVLLEEINDLAEAIMVAERILELFKSPVNIDNKELFPGVSIGIALSKHHHYCQASDLLRDADVAMYWAKHKGRGQYIVFDANMHLQAVQRLQIENNLRRALENEELLLFYQPIINLKTQKIEAFEALLQWQHPEVGLLMPDRFIDIANRIGLISSIEEWILRTVCQQLICWQTLFPKRSLGININFLDERLEESFLLRLERILAFCRPADNSLRLEFTESSLVQNFETAQSLLDRLRDMGVGIVIDDFGVGYSCLRYLHQLPVNAIKIDPSFIGATDLNEVNHVVSESIITLCKSLGLTTIAEDITMRQQLDWLTEIGCDAVQGEYFVGPISFREATRLLQAEELGASIEFE